MKCAAKQLRALNQGGTGIQPVTLGLGGIQTLKCKKKVKYNYFWWSIASNQCYWAFQQIMRMVWSTLKKKNWQFSHIVLQMQVTQHELDKKKIKYISVTGAKIVWVFGIEAYCTRVSWTCDMTEFYYSCICGWKIRGRGKKEKENHIVRLSCARAYTKW